MRHFWVGFVLGLCLIGSLGTVWNATWEAIPDGATALASDIDTFIKDLKVEVRNRLSVESQYGSTTSDDNGLMRPGSARAFAQNGAPTVIAGPGQYDSSAAAYVGAGLGTDEIGATTQDLGVGRLWVDLDGIDDGATALSDNNQLKVWDTTTDLFVPVTAQNASGSGIGARNQIYNGSFEVTDGTGLVAATAVPSGWALVLTPTLAYVSVANTTEGDGLILRTTGNGAALEGVRQTLAGLKEAKTYVYRARVRATATDTCTLTVGDGTTTISDVTATTAVFETLEVEHTTTAGPADVTVDLLSTADLDVCDWDHVTAFEKNRSVDQPGIAVCRSTSVDNTDDAYTAGAFVDALVLCTVNVPGPGYIIQVRGAVTAEIDNNDSGMEMRLRQNCNGAGATTVQNAHAGVGGYVDNATNDILTASLAYTRVVNAGGDQCLYTLEAAGKSFALDRNQGSAGDGVMPLDQPITYLETTLLPTR